MRWCARWWVGLLVAWGLIAPISYAQSQAPADPDTTRLERARPIGPGSSRRAQVSADSLSMVTRNGRRQRELYNNVDVRQGSTRLLSEEAIQFIGQQEYLFLNDVVVQERGDTLRAERVRYDEIRKIGRAQGNVRLSDGEVVVRSPSAVYYSRPKRSEFYGGVTLVDSSSVLKSDQGAYFSNEKRAEFYGNVRMQSDDTYIEADSVTYYRETGRSIARGNVYIERRPDAEGRAQDAQSAASDTTGRTLLFGERAVNRRDPAYSRVEGNAILVQIRMDSTGAPSDTLIVRARQLESTRSDSLQRLIALDSVRIWQRELAATADSVVYDRLFEPDSTTGAYNDDTPALEETRLYQQPVTWFSDTQVVGDTIRVVARRRALDTVFVRQNAFATQEDSATGKIHQLKAQFMTARFVNDSLRTVTAQPNAQTIRFLTDKQDELEGAARVSGDRIILRFRNDKIQDVGVYQGVEQDYFERAIIPEPFQLEGFRWMPEQRPQLETILEERVWQRLGQETPPLVVKIGSVLAREEGASVVPTAHTTPANNDPP